MFLRMFRKFRHCALLKTEKVLSVSVLGTDIICTAISMRSAYLWLEEIGDTGVKYHLSGFASIVLATAITVIICCENMGNRHKSCNHTHFVL